MGTNGAGNIEDKHKTDVGRAETSEGMTSLAISMVWAREEGRVDNGVVDCIACSLEISDLSLES